MSDFTPEQVDRAAEALWFGAGRGSLYGWGNLSETSRQAYLLYAEEILSAAGAPEKVAPVVDEAALADVIHRAACGDICSDSSPMRIDYKAASAVAAYLRGDGQ